MPHGDLEAAQVDFPKGALVRDHVDHHAPVFLVVGGKVLDAGADTPGLDAVDHGGREAAGQQRIFRKVLEVPAAEGVPLDVHPRAEQHGDIRRCRLGAERDADFSQEIDVPGACQRRRGGEAGGGQIAAQAGVGSGRRLAQSVRAIGEHDRGQGETGDRGQAPDIGAGAQVGLFGQRHPGDDGCDFLPDHRTPRRSSRVARIARALLSVMP